VRDAGKQDSAAGHKLIEERELEKRFGAEYLKYRRRTPFVIPRFWKRH